MSTKHYLHKIHTIWGIHNFPEELRIGVSMKKRESGFIPSSALGTQEQ